MRTIKVTAIAWVFCLSGLLSGCDLFNRPMMEYVEENTGFVACRSHSFPGSEGEVLPLETNGAIYIPPASTGNGVIKTAPEGGSVIAVAIENPRLDRLRKNH